MNKSTRLSGGFFSYLVGYVLTSKWSLLIREIESSFGIVIVDLLSYS